ncbi:MAG: hypothetical protein LBP22_05470 [Deltaproteobacteria bacterium]|jgi:hypothetical protein|nr:hypothetical protein [Deltaproteobacteria bacterium]
MAKISKIYILALTVMFSGLLVFSAFLGADEQTSGSRVRDLVGFDRLSDQVSTLTGQAISPALVMFGTGVYHRITKNEDDYSPWFASPIFLTVVGIILAIFLVKDFVPSSAVQKPLAAVEESMMALWGLLGLIASVPFLWNKVGPALESLGSLIFPLVASTALAADIPDLAANTEGGILATTAGALIYIVVWCVSNTINILCLLAPALAAPLLKGFRLVLLGGLLGLNAIHPVLGLIGAVIIIIFSLIVFRWSFKLTVWGLLFSFDLIFRRWRRKPVQGLIPAFAGPLAKKNLKIPKRSAGYLLYENGTLLFRYRPFLIFKKQVQVPGPYFLGEGLLWPVLAVYSEKEKSKAVFAFRLAHKTHERFLCETLGAEKVIDHGFRHKYVRARDWIKGLFRGQESPLDQIN